MTRELLNRAYSLVTERLEQLSSKLLVHSDAQIEALRRLAANLGVNLDESSKEEKHIVQRVAWRPIAEECVVMLLQLLLKNSTGNGHFSQQRLRKLFPEGKELATFSQQVGICPDDTMLALKATATVFFETDLFKRPARIVMNRSAFTIQHENDGLLVSPERAS